MNEWTNYRIFISFLYRSLKHTPKDRSFHLHRHVQPFHQCPYHMFYCGDFLMLRNFCFMLIVFSFLSNSNRTNCSHHAQLVLTFCYFTHNLSTIYVVRRGGLTSTTISPRTKSMPTFRVCFFTISSSVSSSISVLVTVSSTSPKIILRCWSYAWNEKRPMKK